MRIISKRPYILFILFILFIALSACNGSKDSSQKTNSSEINIESMYPSDEIKLRKALSEDKTGVTQAPDECFEHKTNEKKFSCLYERFKYESVLCSKLDKLLTNKGIDTILKKDFYSSSGGTKQLMMFLNNQLRENPDVHYLISHPLYFEIDINFHYNPMGAIGLAKTDMYCAQTMRRLQELESLGRSDLVWRIREKWLDHYFASMDMPWTEMKSLDPEHFFVEFEKVKIIYNSEEDKKNLRLWVDKAEKILFQNAKVEALEGAGGQTKEQQLETLRQWVKRMRQGL